MPPSVVAFLLFLMISLAVTAVLLLIRDIYNRFTNRNADAEAPELQIERFPTAETPRGAMARFDHWFGGVVAESGLQLTPPAAFLLSIGVGLIAGSILFFFRNESLLAASVGFVAGIVVVNAFYLYQRSRRRRMLMAQLPPTMELIARAMRAGQSLDQAIALAGEMGAEPVATEFRRCARQMEMGLSLEAAMRAIARRLPTTETRILASTLVVQRRAGGSLPKALFRLAQVFRERMHYQMRFRAATAASRGSAALITALALGAASYMAIAQPEMARNFIASPQGIVMLITAIVLLFAGLFWISRLLKVQY